MNSPQLRTVWKEFWESKEHALSAPASLIVNNADDPTTMFNTAGMQPLVPYLMGKEHPTWSQRVYNIQWCVRTVDIDEVGDVSHLTYFEMMGNWSLGDYFKQDAITWSWEFLTEVLKLDKDMLCATIFEWDDDAPLDEDAKQIWLDTWLPEHRITALDKKENRWGPAWATWPCGPDSEIFYWIGTGEPPKESNPWNDEHNWLEIWNNVFMWYYKDDKGAITEMEKKNVDTGMWFERILMVIKGQELKKSWKIDAISELSVYDIDVFESIFNAFIPEFKSSPIASQRIVADHIRTAFMLVEEWLIPSNEKRWYVLRRIIRRAYFHTWIRELWLPSDYFLAPIFESLNKTYWNKFSDQCLKIVWDEMNQFFKTLSNWRHMLLEKIIPESKEVVSWDDAFLLYDTFGVPVELTQEIVAGQWLEVDMAWYEAALEAAKQVSRAGAGDKFAKDINRADHIQWLPETKFIGYDRLECTESKILKNFEIQWTRYLVLDCTPFYAEWWGQKGDSWTITLSDGESVQIVDVQKYGGVYLHTVG